MTAEEKAKETVSWNDVKEKYLKFHGMDEYNESMAIDIDFGYWLANEVINEALRRRDPKVELSERYKVVLVKRKKSFRTYHSIGVHCDGVFYSSKTGDVLQGVIGWRPIE